MSIVDALFGPENHLVMNYLRALFFASLVLVFTAPIFAAVHYYEKSKRLKMYARLATFGVINAFIVSLMFSFDYQLINEAGVGCNLAFWLTGVVYIAAIISRLMAASGDNLASLRPTPVYGLMAAIMLFLSTYKQLMI